jgi:hypothetical protein
MADEVLQRDGNHVPVAGGVTDDANEEVRMLRIDDTTKALKVKLIGGSGGGGDTLLASKNWWFINTNDTYDSSRTVISGVDISTNVTPSSGSGFIDLADSGTDCVYAVSTGTMLPAEYDSYIVKWYTSCGVKPVSGENNTKWFFGTGQSEITSMMTATGFTDLGNTCGFLVEYDTDGYYLKAYSSNTAITTEKTTIVAVPDDVTTFFKLKFVVTEQSTIEFYVDGILEATHTTSYPDDAGISYNTMGYGITGGNSTGVFQRIFISLLTAEFHSV